VNPCPSVAGSFPARKNARRLNESPGVILNVKSARQPGVACRRHFFFLAAFFFAGFFVAAFFFTAAFLVAFFLVPEVLAAFFAAFFFVAFLSPKTWS
jgi:hypothetical protein